MNINIKLALVALLLLKITGYAQVRWGIPDWLDVATYAINDYDLLYGTDGKPKDNDLRRQINTANAFAAQIQSKITSKYPEVSTTWRIKRENWDATRFNFINDDNDQDEMIFFGGHGLPNRIYFGDWQNINSTQKSFGGFTKWVFFGSCRTLDTADTVIAHWFNGNHAVLGHAAISYEFITSYNCMPWGCSHNRSEDVWGDFAQRWIINGNSIWVAYRDAIASQMYSDSRGIVPGIKPRIAYVYAIAPDGKLFDGSEETITNVYNGRIFGSIRTKTASYGTPQY